MTHNGERIHQFTYHGRSYWLKQAETLCGWMKLLKPDPLQSIEQEKQVLHQLSAQAVPVPEIVSEGPGYLVLEDAGRTLKEWLKTPGISRQTQLSILKDSASTLAHLHLKGFFHGRPALRDITWQEGKVMFIDFEAQPAQTSPVDSCVRDLLVYLHSLYRYLGPKNQVIQQVIHSYRKAGGESVWQASQRYLQKWQWLYYILLPLRSLGGRDLKPMFWVLWHFRHAEPV